MKLTSRVLLAAAVTCAGAAFSASAAGPVTFTKDVLPILQENCQTCHRPKGANSSGMVAPMSLMTYQETRPWAKAIARVVQSKEMPPWGATKETSHHFRNSRLMAEEDVNTIVDWVKQGARRGNPADAPEPRDFNQTGWRLGEPDMVVTFPEPFFVPDDVEDLYKNITVQLTEEQLPEDRWVKSIEFKPDSEVVHHIIAYASDPEVELDEAETEEGSNLRDRVMLGGNAPGTDEGDFPEGYGILLKKNSNFTFAMHYHKESGPGTGQYDSSEIAIKFHDKPVTHPLEISTIAHGAFEIPPFHPNWRVVGARTFEEDITIISLMPHMHLRGAAAKYTAFYPDGSSEVLLEVPEYDFNWQIQYEYPFDNLKTMPAGTRIEFEIFYDNSKEQAEYAGFDPSRAVRFGGPTTDEMDLGWLTFAPTEPMEVATAAGDD